MSGMRCKPSLLISSNVSSAFLISFARVLLYPPSLAFWIDFTNNDLFLAFIPSNKPKTETYVFEQLCGQLTSETGFKNKTKHFVIGIYKIFYNIIDNQRSLPALTKLPGKISNIFIY